MIESVPAAAGALRRAVHSILPHKVTD